MLDLHRLSMKNRQRSRTEKRLRNQMEQLHRSTPLIHGAKMDYQLRKSIGTFYQNPIRTNKNRSKFTRNQACYTRTRTDSIQRFCGFVKCVDIYKNNCDALREEGHKVDRKRKNKQHQNGNNTPHATSTEPRREFFSELYPFSQSASQFFCRLLVILFLPSSA